MALFEGVTSGEVGNGRGVDKQRRRIDRFSFTREEQVHN
jgi:hypothetical protein